jgi:hypothetical protein
MPSLVIVEYLYKYIIKINEAAYLGYMFRTVGTRIPHLQARDSSKLSHVFEYAPTRFGSETIG